MTKVSCKKSSVTQVVPGTCTATYSDGAVGHGTASVLTAKGDVDREPTTAVSYGDGG